jgi:serine/threonine protein kinase
MEGSVDRFLGMVLHGYTLETCLGRGTLTTVYRARTAAGGLPMLVTFLVLPETCSAQAHWQFRERFWQLAERIEALRHPNLLPLYGYGERHGQCYLLTPELPGVPLFASLHRRRSWPPEEALQVLVPLASALTCLHQHELTCQFFHPATLLLLEGQDDLAHALQLTGCGLMQLVRSLDLTEEEALPAAYHHLQSISGQYLGAPDYLAPEVVQGRKADVRSDVYTLGILLFTLLSGRPPFTGQQYLEIARHHLTAPLPSLHALVPTLPIALEQVLNQALHRDPAARFPHPHALLDAYRSIVADRVPMPSYPLAFQHITRPGMPQPISPVSLPREPTSEPLPVVTPDSLWQRRIEHLRATAQASTAPLLPAVTASATSPHAPLVPETPKEKARQTTINQMIQDIQQHRERLQDLAHGFGQETTEELQKATVLERFPGWLT